MKVTLKLRDVGRRRARHRAKPARQWVLTSYPRPGITVSTVGSREMLERLSRLIKEGDRYVKQLRAERGAVSRSEVP